MNFHFILELITVVLAMSTIVFSYPLYKKHSETDSLYWFVKWGIWMSCFSLIHAMLSLTCYSQIIFINCSEDIERIINATLVMLCVYPGKGDQNLFFNIHLKTWFNILMPVIMLIVLALSFVSNNYIPSDHLTISFKIIQIIFISIIFGRLVDIISIWAKILRWALFFMVMASISSLYSNQLYDSMFYVGHIFKIACYTTMMIAITYMWYRISTFNGNTLKQIIGTYYGTPKLSVG